MVSFISSRAGPDGCSSGGIVWTGRLVAIGSGIWVDPDAVIGITIPLYTTGAKKNDDADENNTGNQVFDLVRLHGYRTFVDQTMAPVCASTKAI